MADNDKISRKGHRTAPRCCRCPFYFISAQLATDSRPIPLSSINSVFVKTITISRFFRCFVNFSDFRCIISTNKKLHSHAYFCNHLIWRSNMDSEKIATNHVELAISKAGHLVSHINSNDKEPSWDGDVEVYKKSGHVHAKADLILKVPVQVKGHIKPNLKKKSIKYSIQYSDLRNYLYVGGTIFFVVYFDKEDEHYTIYYVGLLPFDLKKMLKDYKGDFSKCKSIELKVFPTKKEDIDDIFLNFAHHMNRQRAAINSALLSFDSDLPTNTISLGYSTSAAKHYDLPLDYFFDHETYIYAVLPQKVELPIAHLDRIELFSFTRDAPISIDSKVYFESYTVTRSKSSTVIRFGKGIQMSFSTAQSLPTKFNFTLSGTLSERIKDAEFMVAALSAHHYEINGGKIAFSEADCANLPTLQKKLSFLLDVKKTLEAVHATADLDCSSLSVTDNTNLSILRAALIDKEPIKMCSSQSLLRSCHIANLELLLWVVPTEENSEYHNIYDFNYVPLIYREFDKNDKEYPSTHFVMLNKDAMLKYCNIDYNALLDAVQHVPFSKDYSHSLNALLLEMLKAYDESKNSRIELLSTATTLALWIKDSDPYTEHPIAILNYLQSVKRSRTLTSTEQAEILSLIEAAQDNESIYVGAYLLLDNPVAAKIHFDKLPEESQKFFESCPIYHFMPNGQPTISAPTEG